MFEAQVAYYLNRYLGKYLDGLETESLKISVWKGDVELRNLHLKPEALADLDLPITVKAGLLGKLTLKVPWARLGKEPVVVEFDRLYILAGPRGEAEAQAGKKQSHHQQQSPSDYARDVEAADQEVKLKRVAEAEAEWIAEMEARHTDDKGSGGGGSKAISAFIEPILGNLQLVLTNVHVRFEDDGAAWAGHSMAAGVTLRRVAAHTVDENGRPAFVTSGVLDVMRKAMSLAQLGVYFDVDRPLMSLPRGAASWAALTPQQWDDLFSPGLHMPAASAGEGAGDRPSFLGYSPHSFSQPQGVGSGGGYNLGSGRTSLPAHSAHLPALGAMIYEHDFLVAPISGGLRYTRRSAKTLSSLRAAAGKQGASEIAAQECALSLGEVALQLSTSQYSGAQALAETLDSAVTAAPHRHLRPQFRPTDGKSARAWWTYAMLVCSRHLARGRMSWAALGRAAALRKTYVAAYARWLDDGKPASSTDAKSIRAMDAQLDAGAIIRFRRMAYTKVEARKGPRHAKSASMSVSMRGASGTGGSWGTWLGWRSRAPTPGAGGGGGSSRAGEGGGREEEDGDEAVGGGRLGMRSGLSEEEWRRLEELLEEQQAGGAEEALASGSDNPYALATQASVSVESLSLLLLNPTTTNSNARKGTAHGATAATHGPASRGTSTAHAQAGPTEPSAGNSEPGVVVDASLQCLVLQARMYPRSLGVAMRVGAAGVSSPQGQLFNTGVITSQQAQEGMGVSLSGSGTGTLGLDPCLLQPLQLNLPGVGAAGSAPTSLDGAPSQAGPSCALALDFTQAPQDNSADAVVQLLVAPSYVTYVPAAFDAISNFFSPPGAASRELVALQARAAAQAEALKQLAALRLRSLSLARDKPKLLVHAVAHAPKIAIPNATSTTVLLLDLGRFVMRSSREQAASLPDEEAALYECLSVQLDHVSAHIADEAPRRASLSRSRRLRPSHAASHTGSSPVPGHTSFVWPSRPVGSQTGGGGMAAGGSAGGAGGAGGVGGA